MTSCNKNKFHYLVVEFPEEEEDGEIPMNIISSNWTQKELDLYYCYWPSFKSDEQRVKAVIKHAVIDPAICSKCLIVIKFKTDNYQTARSKLKYLETHSSVSSESEDNDSRVRLERRRQLVQFNDYEYDTDYSDKLPTPPKLKFNKDNKKNQQKNKEIPIDTLANTPPSSPLSAFSRTPRSRPHSTQSELDTTITNSTLVCKNCQQNTELLKQVILQITKISVNTKHILAEVVKTDAKLTIATEEFEQIHEIAAFHEFNTKLENTDFFKQMSFLLQPIGGKDGFETVRRILAKIIGNDLAKTFNWYGRNNRNNFSFATNVIKLVLGVTRQNPLSKDMTQKEVETVIKSWLRTATDREGGRSRRRALSAN